MEITELFDVIDEAFGRRRWLQHSPISPDIWETYLEAGASPAGAPPHRCDVLLTASSGSEPAQIAQALRLAITAINRPVPDAQVASNANSVVANLTLQELVCCATPLTRWWQSLPPDLRDVSSLRHAFKDPTLVFDTSDKVEFFSFAATAGLVHLVTSGRTTSLLEDRKFRLTDRLVERSARVSSHETNHYILEMLGAFDELLPNLEQISETSSKTKIEHIHSNRRSQLSIAFSRKTIKADACENLFHASAAGITWAVVDSGIDAQHPCFATTDPPTAPDTFSSRISETYDFTRVRSILSNPAGPGLGIDKEAADRLLDRLNQGLTIDWSLLREQLRVRHDAAYPPPKQEHGTHVAGIIGANWPAGPAPYPIVGICPDIKLLDVRVFDDSGTTDEFTILSALQFLSYLNGLSMVPLVHGVNLSFSLVHKVRSFGCGRTPICDACESLVNSKIVVVAAAGNFGYSGDSGRPSLDDRYATVSITDPGNAEAAITVGSTHKISPASYGVSYFSSRGPTGDGRSKPDILAPGEKILSALPQSRWGEMDGTSMAAPHVSGAAAILLARYPELANAPSEVKRILCESATSLGREPAFQGAGLVDVLRALQMPWSYS